MAIAMIDLVEDTLTDDGVDDGRDDVMVVCITGNAETRARVAELVGQFGVVVMAPDARHAHSFLERALGRHEPADDAVEVSGLVIDRSRHRARWRGKPIELTNQEFELLAQLAGDPDRVWTYHALHDAVWRSPYLGDTSSLHSAVKRLRSKLRRAGASVGIVSVRSVGFRLDHEPCIDLRD